MKINKKALLTLGCLSIITSLYITKDFNTVTNKNTQPKTAYAQSSNNLDTKYKSADNQFETNIGTFMELPLYKNNEKIKNVFYSNSSLSEISINDIIELQNMIKKSNYKYDEVFIELNNGKCIKYNAYKNHALIGTLEDNFNLTDYTEYPIN